MDATTGGTSTGPSEATGTSPECPSGFCSTVLSDNHGYGQLTQLGDDVVLVERNGTAQPSQLMTVGLDATLTTLGPVVAGEVSAIARGADGIVTAAYYTASSRHVVRLEGESWVEVDLSLPDETVVVPTGVFATPGSPTYVLASTTTGAGPVYRLDGGALVFEGTNASTMIGRGADDLWALDGSDARNWNGVEWSEVFDLPAFCSFGVVLDDAALCGSTLGTETAHWDGGNWTGGSIPDVFTVAGMTARDGTVRAVGSAGDSIGVSTWNGSGWDTTLVDLQLNSPDLQVTPGVATLSDGRLAFLSTLNSSGFVDQTVLVFEE